eukprot:m.355315 g.355315  ORF g.355315 m.355315 type:complete len:54 (-) comp17218_c0_seq1:3620-3781(-)
MHATCHHPSFSELETTESIQEILLELHKGELASEYLLAHTADALMALATASST